MIVVGEGVGGVMAKADVLLEHGVGGLSFLELCLELGRLEDDVASVDVMGDGGDEWDNDMCEKVVDVREICTGGECVGYVQECGSEGVLREAGRKALSIGRFVSFGPSRWDWFDVGEVLEPSFCNTR